MLVFFFCLISFTRTTFVFLSEKIFASMERRSNSTTRSIDDRENDDTIISDSLKKEFKEDDTGIQDDSVFTSSSIGSTRRCRSVIDCIGTSDDFPPQTSIKQKTRRVKSSPDVELQDQGHSSIPESVESQRVERTSRRVDTIDANIRNVPTDDDDDDDDDTRTRKISVSIPVRKDDLCYNMTHIKRGRCIIFNHETFDTGFDERKGSSADAKRIESTFTTLGFEVEILDDRLHSEVLAKISELSEEDHTNNDCLCIFILTHGLSNDLISAKDVAYRSDGIWKAFTADKCTSLAGKPKLFFFQACRGEKLDGGVMVRRSSERTETDSSVASYKIPTHADFLIAHSTVQGFLSWRNPEEGTWYVQCLCDVIDQYWRTTDLLSMLTITARKVATEYTSYDDLNPAKHEQTQVPSMTSMLIRDIYFTPK